jgi:hypothetical protein
MVSMRCTFSWGSFTGVTRWRYPRPSLPIKHRFTPHSGSDSAAPRSKLVVNLTVYTVCGLLLLACGMENTGLDRLREVQKPPAAAACWHTHRCLVHRGGH